MSHSFKNVIKKIQDYLFGKEIDLLEHRENEQKLKKTSKSKGRIESDERKGETRVIHQYPKQGSFRFPVIEDKPPKAQRSSEQAKANKSEQLFKQTQEKHPKKQVEVSQEEKKISPYPTKKFSGQNFKASSIPSPIYGFRNRSNTDHLVHNDTLKEKVNQQEEVQSVVTNQAADVEVASTKQPLVKVGMEELELQEDKFVESEETLENHEFIETEQPMTNNGDMEKEEIGNKGNIKSKESKENEESAESDEVIVSEKTIEDKYLCKSEEVIEYDQYEPTSTIDAEPLSDIADDHRIAEDNESDEQIEESYGTESDDDRTDKAEKNETKQEDSNEHSQTFDKSSRVVIPYNVLMYKKDKKKIEEAPSPLEENKYQFPSITLLDIPPASNEDDSEWLKEQRQLLVRTLENFHVSAKVIDVTKGPSVTRFEVQPDLGVKVSKITNLTDDIKLSLAAKDIRIEAPIPGRNAIGIEVPNKTSSPVGIRQIIRSKEFQSSASPLTVVMGLDISGKAIVTDIQKMPHGLIAGATGSGKSVCINSILISLMFKAKPDDVKLILIDPKMVELAPYNEIPHLVSPVITDAKQATMALKWVVEEMERRYELFAQSGVRDIKRYNHIHSQEGDEALSLPYIVVIIDELADLMMVSPQDVEDAICRIAQKARACGIHLLLATQRPSVDVITGLIKANIPTRIAFSVSSQVDSRTIIDSSGAERLLGKGDMLFMENGSGKPLRVQGNFVSDDEIDRVIDFVKKQGQPDYLFTKDQLTHNQAMSDQEDDLFEEACLYVLEQEMASASSLQRRFRMGFNRAARLIEMMEQQGIVSEAMGSKPRNVLITRKDFEERQSLTQQIE